MGRSPITVSIVDGRPVVEVAAFRLDVVEGTDAGTTCPSSGGRLAVGTAPGNTLVLRDPTVSRSHCELVARAGRVRIRDLESKNGVVLDGISIAEAELRHGSIFRLGRTAIAFTQTGRRDHLPLLQGSQWAGMVGSSIVMRQVFAELERAARTDITVLLEGETGTGKEAAARGIHAQSARAGRPFVVVDCGSIAAGLIESELFGHERGAFTGATDSRDGAFVRAHGGTIFLDEIGELPLELQPRLLRALDAREVRPVGGSPIAVDLRIIAATHRDLRAEVNEGRFRADLYYRLAVARVVLPPLRERPEDIAMLASVLTARMPADTRSTLAEPSFVAEMAGSAWPGNVRELRNFLERCGVEGPQAPTTAAPSTSLTITTNLPLRESRRLLLDDFERRYLAALLERYGRNLTEVARHAGVSRPTIYALLERHGLR